MYVEAQPHQGKPLDFPGKKLREIDPFPIGESSDAFRERHFPDCSRDHWNDWIWQLRHSFKSAEALSSILALTPDETEAIQSENHRLPLRITPYYASLCLNPDPQDPLRRTVIPTTAEWARSPAESLDPLQEDSHSPVPGLVHRYPDRALFLVSEQCACYCRYCTRSRRVGVKRGISMGKAVWEKAVSYIEATPTIRDVIISGGDPLMLPDDAIVWLLTQICRIPHVEMVRIGTKMPIVLPQRITHALISRLKPFKPLYVSLHVTHPKELTPEMAEACDRLADAGICLGSQTVLLKGINDSVLIMKALMHGLLKNRVKPYYLFQCDPIFGTEHFRTSVATGLHILEGLQGHTSGYAVPNYVIDTPGGGGKVRLLPPNLLGETDGYLALRNYEGKTFYYPKE